MPDEKHFKLVVECDGHEFHERTKDQAQRDRRRDRLLQDAGYRVMRFTGFEIYNDAYGCAMEIVTWAGKTIGALEFTPLDENR